MLYLFLVQLEYLGNNMNTEHSILEEALKKKINDEYLIKNKNKEDSLLDQKEENYKFLYW
jgi:hypothetical protein